MQLRYVLRKQVSRVDLQKDGTTPIGIVLKDGVKTGSRPVIKSIKKGSIAYRSHCVSAKDAIVSVCGQDARGMSRRDFKQLLREAESKIELELEYHIQEACLNKCGVYRMERIVLKLKKESESYGFVLRKSVLSHAVSRGYPIIGYIKDGGPADRDGRLKAGDRLLQIDEQNLEALTLSQVSDILQAKDEATFTIEYKIALIENSQIKLGERTDLELDCPDADLGLVLGSSGSRMIIEEIRKGSLADRCGAFRVGDDIVSINDSDVSFLSISKANSLLRSFKKEPGRLSLVANIERQARPIQNLYLTSEKIGPFFKQISSQMTPERDQQVPSSDNILASDDSPQSLFNGNLEHRTTSLSKCDYYRFQIKTIVMLQEVIGSIIHLESFIPTLTRNNNGSMVNSDEVEGNRDQNIQCSKLTHLKILSTRIKNSAHSMAMHLLKNGESVSNRHLENGAHSNDCFTDNDEHLNQDNVIQELMKNLVEIYTKKLISKRDLEKIKLKFDKVDSNCLKCGESCMLAALTFQKIFLNVLLNSKTKHNCSLTMEFLKDIFRIIPCEDCRLCSGSQTGSGIFRTTRHFRSLNHLNTKTSSLEYSTNEKTAWNLTGPTRTYLPGGSSINTSSHLHAKPSSSTHSFLSTQTGFESSKSVDGASANVSIPKHSSHETISDLNCKTKAINPTRTSSYKKRYQRDREAAENGSQSFTTHPLLSQIEKKTLHNSSLGFATSAQTHSLALDDRASISGNSNPQTPTETLSETQNNSFSTETELFPCKDNANYGPIRNCKNYSSSIRKKIFKGKGLLTSQRKKSKSAEVLIDSGSESLKYSNTKIQKLPSEPQFLSTRCQSSNENVEKDEHFYANVEILNSESRKARAQANPISYWSPFQGSDFSDNPNILDIPNWSAKSSHSAKQIDQISDERTTQDTMDVTLKNEGKGFGLSVEFLDSPTEDLIPVPRITAVSSQGAAHKIGILQKGDRVLSINGQSTTCMTATEFDRLTAEAFSGDEVLLTVEFDVVMKELKFGTFDVCVTKTSKTGLIYNEFQKGCPLVVKGLVKGSPAHRCGSLMPGDEVLYANNIRQEFYDVSKNSYERSEVVIIRVKRLISEEKIGDELNLEQAELFHFRTHDLSRTSIHSNHESNKMFLEQELTLYRDPVSKDFGFLIGQDQVSKSIYVTGIRPNGPADCSKVIKKNDIILQVNGVDLESNKEGPVASLFHPKGDRLELKTRRILKYE